MMRDSVAVRYVDSLVIRDSTVLVAIPDEMSEAVRPSSDTSHIETSVAVSDAWVDGDGVLHHFIRNKSWERLPAVVQMVDRARTMDGSVVKTVIKEVEKELTRWQKLLMASGKMMLIILLACIVCFLLKIMK